VQPAELARDLDAMILAQGEPFGSTSIYAQYRVFQLAQQCGIKVLLEGQGADELLAGYHGYPMARLRSLLATGNLGAALRLRQRWAAWPDRRAATSWLALAAAAVPDGMTPVAASLMGRNRLPAWLRPQILRAHGICLENERRPSAEPGRALVAALAADLSCRGLPPLLRHGDRNSMHFSIESRVPFLTTTMADLLLGLPESYLLSDEGQTKHIFRAAMRGIVPDSILDRRDKIGFATPEHAWLKLLAPELRRWLADAPTLSFLDHSMINRHCEDIISGRRRFSWQLWRWLNFLRWTALFDVQEPL